MPFDEFFRDLRVGELEQLQKLSEEIDGSVYERVHEILDRRRQEMDATILFCHTLYEHLRRRGLLDEAEFEALYDELDMRDGMRDHRAQGRTLPGTEGKAGG